MRDNQRGSARNTLEDDRAGQTPVAALRHRDFAIYWSGSVVSLVGSQFTTVAMAWQIYELTNSPLELGLLGLARARSDAGVAPLGGLPGRRSEPASSYDGDADCVKCVSRPLSP